MPLLHCWILELHSYCHVGLTGNSHSETLHILIYFILFRFCLASKVWTGCPPRWLLLIPAGHSDPVEYCMYFEISIKIWTFFPLCTRLAQIGQGVEPSESWCRNRIGWSSACGAKYNKDCQAEKYAPHPEILLQRHLQPWWSCTGGWSVNAPWLTAAAVKTEKSARTWLPVWFDSIC